VRNLRDRLRAWTFGLELAVLAGLPFLGLFLAAVAEGVQPTLVLLGVLGLAGLAAIALLWLAWMVALARLAAAEEAALRAPRLRQDARWNAAVGIGMLFVGGGSAVLGIAGLNLLSVLTGLLHLGAAGLTALRIPRRDPWAYDPDLDEPAEETDDPAAAAPAGEPDHPSASP
jgi:hypothetical protein